MLVHPTKSLDRHELYYAYYCLFYVLLTNSET